MMTLLHRGMQGLMGVGRQAGRLGVVLQFWERSAEDRSCTHPTSVAFLSARGHLVDTGGTAADTPELCPSL